MTTKEFEKGYKLLVRYFKDIGRYNDFITITVKHDRNYKDKLFDTFNVHSVGGWEKYFSYTFFVGENYNDYGDPHLDTLRAGWLEYMSKYFDEH